MDCCFEVHRNLGPGLLESVYSQCLVYELRSIGLKVEVEKPIPIEYKGITMECGFRIDLLVDRAIIVELKSTDSINDLHFAQILTYMRIAKIDLGMLVNFNTKLLKNGMKRIVL
jgi:GxxExxY protein